MPWVNGEWVDDDEIVYDDGMGADAYNNQWLNPGMFGEQVPGFLPEYNKYGNEVPYDIGSQGQQLTQFKKALDLIFNPKMAYFNSVMNGAPTVDYNQFLPGGGVGGDTRLGGLGGGGGGGGAGGGGAAYQTPYLDALAKSSDPYLQGIYEDFQAGMSPSEIKLGIASGPETDQGTIDVLNDTIDRAWTEVAGAQIAAGQPGPQRELSPMEEMIAGTGMPGPTEGYTADNLPSEASPGLDNVSSYLQARLGRLGGVDRQVQGLDDDIAALAAQMRTAQRAGRSAPSAVAATPGPRATHTLGDPLTNSREATPGTTAEWSNMQARGRNRYLAGQAQEAKETANAGLAQRPPYLARVPGQPEIDLTRQQQQLQKQRRVLQAQAENEQGQVGAVDRGVRTLVARRLQGEGRTPQRDAMSAQLNMLRQMGLRI